MKLLKLYELFTGKMTDFLSQFQNNESLYQQARVFWNKLEGISTILLIIFFVVGIALAFFYYKPYNNRPGRHFTPAHWLFFFLITFLAGFAVTYGIEYFMVPPRLNGAWKIEFMIALGNAIYASIVYLIVSIIWCNANALPTNAYRLFKF